MSLLVEGAARSKELVFKHFPAPMPLKIIDNPSFNEGRKADKGHNWEVAASQYYSIFKDPQKSVYDQTRAGVEVAQMLINVMRYGQAGNLLDEVESKIENLTERDGNLIKARLYEKRAWISGYTGFFDRELEELQLAEGNLKKIPTETWTTEEDNLESTIGHFSGRANYAKGAMSIGKKRQELLDLSLDYFTIERDRLEKWRQNGNPQPENEAYQHLWIAKAYLMMSQEDHLKAAAEEAALARALFEEGENPKDLGHSFVLEGAIQIKNGNPQLARELFNNAVKIWGEKGSSPYLRGKAEAYGGIAISYFSEGKMGYYTIYASEAIKILLFGS